MCHTVVGMRLGKGCVTVGGMRLGKGCVTQWVV